MKPFVFFTFFFSLKSFLDQWPRRLYSGGAAVCYDRRGVTLMELMTALAILSVVAAVSGLGLFRNMPERRLMNASREIYCGLRHAQSQAVSRGTTITVAFDPEADSFSMMDEEGRLIGQKQLPGDVDLFDIKGDNQEENQFFFNSLGIKTGMSGSVRLRCRQPGYAERRILVMSTGAMKIQRSDGGKV